MAFRFGAGAQFCFLEIRLERSKEFYQNILDILNTIQKNQMNWQ